jgi:4-hydroxybenzoyl-CoA thioesterase
VIVRKAKGGLYGGKGGVRKPVGAEIGHKTRPPPGAPGQRPAYHRSGGLPMTFIKPYLIRLSHCDPTGFVFYPNYFHIFNALVEDWFYEALEIPFDAFLMERRLSLPTVRLETTFTKPTRMGEMVDFWLTASHIGRTSLRLTMGVDKNGEQRVRMNRVAVCISQETDKPVDIPDDVRRKIADFMRG